jgi:spore coat polysaccharide biosynthesis protein SpsF (cytidylyltransferase family)
MNQEVTPPSSRLTESPVRPSGKTVAIIQARMGSTRLPGKALQKIAGEPMLRHVWERACQARTLDQTLVATSTANMDNAIADYCAWHGIPCFRGSENDVLDRYYHAAHFAHAETVVRLTADCPLLDPAVIDSVVSTFRLGTFDYLSNIDPPTYPDGLDTEVFTFAALERAWHDASLPSEREHVTPYLRASANCFRTGNVTCPTDLSHLRWTVDELADLTFVRNVFHVLGTTSCGLAEIVALLEHSPHLSRLNASYTRNEGYQRSLLADQKVA